MTCKPQERRNEPQTLWNDMRMGTGIRISRADTFFTETRTALQDPAKLAVGHGTRVNVRPRGEQLKNRGEHVAFFLSLPSSLPEAGSQCSDVVSYPPFPTEQSRSWLKRTLYCLGAA